MQIRIRGAAPSHNFDVDVDSADTTVEQLKTRILEKFNAEGGPEVSMDRIRLICMARVMDNASPLSAYRIEDGQTVHMVLRQLTDATGSGAASPQPQHPTMPTAGTMPPMFGGFQQQRQGGTGVGGAELFTQIMSNIPQLLSGVQAAVSGGVPPATGGAAAAPTGPASPPSATTPPANATRSQQQPAQADTNNNGAASSVPGVGPGAPFAHHHHHHQHHHHHHMLQHHAHHMMMHQQHMQRVLEQQQNQLQQTPGIAGVHVHVHVNLDELEVLPERLERLRQRVPGNVQVQTHLPQQPSQPQSGSAQAAVGSQAAAASAHAAAQRVADQISRQPAASQSSVPQGQFGTTATTAAVSSRPSGATSGGGSAASPATAAAPVAPQLPSQQQAPSAAAPRPTLSEVVARAGVQDDRSEAHSLLDVFSRHLMDSFNVPDLMMLINGIWTPLEKVREPARRYVKDYFDAHYPEPMRNTTEARQRFALTTARSIVQGMVDNPEIYGVIRPRQRQGANVFQAMEYGLYRTMLDLTNLLLDGNATGPQFTAPLRVITIRGVGQLLFYAQRELLNRAGEDLDFIVQNLLRIAIAAAGREAPGLQGQLAAMGPMALGIATNTLAQWQQEYLLRHRLPTDDSIFSTEPPRFAALPPLPAAPVAPAAAVPSPAARGDVDVDALLDEAMDETESSTGNGNSAAATTLRSALLGAGVLVDEVDDLLADLMRTDPTTGGSASPSEAEAPHSDIFNSICGSSKKK